MTNPLIALTICLSLAACKTVGTGSEGNALPESSSVTAATPDHAFICKSSSAFPEPTELIVESESAVTWDGETYPSDPNYKPGSWAADLDAHKTYVFFVEPSLTGETSPYRQVLAIDKGVLASAQTLQVVFHADSGPEFSGGTAALACDPKPIDVENPDTISANDR